MSRFLAAAALLLSLSVGPVFAAEPMLYKIDPGHTRVLFFVKHLGFSHMPGVFNNVTGTVNFDPDRAEQSKVDVTIDAHDVTVNHKVLDQKLQGKDYFDTAKYPTITFKSNKIETTGLETGKLTGDLTFLGVTLPVTLDVRFNHKAWNKYEGGQAIGFTATGEINRSDFGMRTNLPDVGDEIALRIELEAQEAKPKLPTYNGAPVTLAPESGSGGLDVGR